MYTKKQVNDRIKQALSDNDKELAGMLGHLHQLKFSWIPQIKKRFLAPDEGGLYTPHRCVLKQSVIDEIIAKHENKVNE